MNSILKQDLEEIISSNLLDWRKIDNHSFIITGATGLIGSIIVKVFSMRNSLYNSKIEMYIPTRSIENAQNILGTSQYLHFIETSIESFHDVINVDYIIHGASQTKSKAFVNNPVETIDTSVLGTKNLLEIARKTSVKSMVYLSSMEMYGVLNSDNVKENDLGYIDPLNVRSSYSEGKRICELYCYSYFHEYDIPVKIGRIAQTFGAGISKNENRVYKCFADSILRKENIILKSKGNTKINYSYTTDTVIGLLYILLNGKNGDAYNVVGEKTKMTILDSAEWLITEFGDKNSKVIIDLSDSNTGFAPENQMVLNNDKLKSIGWICKYDLKAGYKRLIDYMKEELEKEE